MGKAIGIDLGTTNSVVAVMEGGKPTVIVNTEGSRLTPSVVAFTKTGERLVGQLAKRQSVLNAENTIYSAKRFIGRRYSEVQSEIKNVPYKVVAGPNDAVRFEIMGKQYAPEEISAQVLRKLADDAAKYLGEKANDAVITVPAVELRAFQKVEGSAGLGKIEAALIKDSGNPHRQQVVNAPHGAKAHAFIARQQHRDVALVLAERTGQRTDNITETSAFGKRRGFGGNHQNLDHDREV